MVDLQIFETQRPRLFALAYRMLGSASDAEDVVQDAWLRLSRMEHDGEADADPDRPATSGGEVRSPRAFAATVVTRLCLDRLKSARHRREEYVGPWLPEPVLTSDRDTPDALVARSESITLAFLLLLETVSAEERAVFLLKEAFGYQHAEIARMLGLTPANTRQIFHRATSKIRHRRRGRARALRDRGAQLAVAERFARAFQSSDAAALTQLLAEDVTFVSDGGGKVAAARRPLAGRDEVLKFLSGLGRAARATGIATRVTMQVVEINAEPAIVVRIDGQLDGVFVLSGTEGAVDNIRVVRNPDKLAFLSRQLGSVN